MIEEWGLKDKGNGWGEEIKDFRFMILDWWSRNEDWRTRGMGERKGFMILDWWLRNEDWRTKRRGEGEGVKGLTIFRRFAFRTVTLRTTWTTGELPWHPSLPQVEYPTPINGPVAQLGARLNRTEEVESSNLSRSTRIVGIVDWWLKIGDWASTSIIHNQQSAMMN